MQFTDAYTFNFYYLGTRTTGNDGGTFLVAGPNGASLRDGGYNRQYRTQLFDPSDVENVKKIQAEYKVEPLSAFLDTAAPQAPPDIDFIKPLTKQAQKTSLDFFNIVNFVLQFCPTDPTETELMPRFAKIGVGAQEGCRWRVDAADPRSAITGTATGSMSTKITNSDIGQKRLERPLRSLSRQLRRWA